MKLIEKQYFSDGLCSLYWYEAPKGSARWKTSGAGAIKRKMKGWYIEIRAAGAAAPGRPAASLSEAGLGLLKRCHSTKGCCLCPSRPSGIAPFPWQPERLPATVTPGARAFCFLPSEAFSFLSALLPPGKIAEKCSLMSPRLRCWECTRKGGWVEKTSLRKDFMRTHLSHNNCGCLEEGELSRGLEHSSGRMQWFYSLSFGLCF